MLRNRPGVLSAERSAAARWRAAVLRSSLELLARAPAGYAQWHLYERAWGTRTPSAPAPPCGLA